MRRPPTLGPGARVALIAPAGPLRNANELDTAVANAESLGWVVSVGAHVLSREGYLAGADAERLADLNNALKGSSTDAIWCVRGGYGSMRLLHHIDYDALARRPRAVIGFSDVTAMHAAFGRRANLVTFHGPTARGALTAFSRDSLVRAVVTGTDSCGIASGARTLAGGRARGRLVGGNLALLASLAGTPYAPDYDGAILVLEDVGEQTYRIDRMLTQLALSGALSRLAGLVAGQFTDGTPSHDASSRTLDDVLCEAAAIAGVPAIAGAPIGHVDEQWTVPLGALAELDADARTLHVTGA